MGFGAIHFNESPPYKDPFDCIDTCNVSEATVLSPSQCRSFDLFDVLLSILVRVKSTTTIFQGTDLESSSGFVNHHRKRETEFWKDDITYLHPPMDRSDVPTVSDGDN